MSPQDTHNYNHLWQPLMSRFASCFLLLYIAPLRALSHIIFLQNSLSLRYVCVSVLSVLLLGQQHCESGLGEWVEFTGGKRSL